MLSKANMALDPDNKLSIVKEEFDRLDNELRDALDECDPGALLELSDQLKQATHEVKLFVQDQTPTTTSQDGGELEIAKSLESSINDLRDLIILTKGIVNHLYGQLVSTDIADPVLIQAAAEFIRSSRESLSEFIQLYRDERTFFHRTQLAQLQFSHRKALIKYKMDLENEKRVYDSDDNDETEEMIKYNQEKIVSVLNDMDKNLS